MYFKTNSWPKPLSIQSEISRGASLGKENQCLYNWSRLHDQDGRHIHILYAKFFNPLFQNIKSENLETWYDPLITRYLQCLYK